MRDLFLPPRCLTCQKRVLEAGCLCAACWREVHFIDHPLCPITGVPFSRPWPPDMPSAQSRLFPPNYDKARTLMSYDSQTARALITRMKYRDSPEIAAYAARWFMRLARPLLESADALIPVPLHRRRLFGRRFNQSAEIARVRFHAKAACAIFPISFCEAETHAPKQACAAPKGAAMSRAFFTAPRNRRERLKIALSFWLMML